MPSRPGPRSVHQREVQLLCQKVQAGDEDGVKQYLRQNPQLVNLRDENSGFCPLHVAARYNFPNIVAILVDASAEVNLKSKGQGVTALHIAARLKDRKREAALVREATIVNQTEQADDDDEPDFLTDLAGQMGIAPPAPPPTDTSTKVSRSTTEILMSCPDIVPNIKDSLQETPLHYAARWGNVEECKVMLDKGRKLQNKINLELKDKDGMTPLHHACHHKCSKTNEQPNMQQGEISNYHTIASLLMLSQADIQAKDKMGNTPLHLAADEGCLEITKDLLDTAADARIHQLLLGAKNNEGDTALNIAVRRNHYEVTRHILTKGTDEIGVANNNGDMPLHNCNHVGIFKTLIENSADVNAANKDGSTPLHVAAQDNRLPILAELEKMKDDVSFNCEDNNCRTPLHIAAQHGCSAVVYRMLKNKAFNKSAQDIEGKTALYLAAENNHEKVLEAMFDKEGPMLNYIEESDNSKQQTPLHIAAKNGHVDVVKILIQNGAQVRAKHHGGKTPLHLACQYGRFVVVKELIGYESASIHDTDDRMNTPLHLAAFWGNFGIVQYLINNKANVNSKNDKDKTPLFLAAEQGWQKTSEILLNASVDVTIEDINKRTALQISCMEGHVEVVAMLLQHWRDMVEQDVKWRDVKDRENYDWKNLMAHNDKDGKNCLDLAVEGGHEVIAEMIVSTEGARPFVMENCDAIVSDRPAVINTPMRKLIKYMPSVAEMVFNQCMNLEGNTVTFDYTYLDDAHSRRQWAAKTQPVKSSKTEDDDMETEQRTYKTYKKTHVLTVLATSEKLELLSHPLVSGLLRRKNHGKAMLIFYLQLIVYAIFLAFLTAFMTSSIPPYKFATDYPLVGNGSDCERLEAGGYRQPVYSTVLQYITLIFAAVLLISEVIQLYQKKKGYFEFENLIEWIIFVFAIIVTIDFTGCSDVTSYRYEWQWSIGTASMFFGWINLAFYIQKFPTVGIYIMMFKDILSTFLEFFIVYVLFIIAFALGFYSEMRNTAAYANFWLAFVKTSVMMTGEFDFGDDFVTGDLNNEAATYILFVCFFICMTILVMNLLVGLAVDDIKMIQDKAKLKRLQMQVDLVLDLESVVQVGLCGLAEMGMTETITLSDKPRKLPFNLNTYFGLESYGITKEAVQAAKNPEKSDVSKIQEEQQNLKLQNEKLKLKLKNQDETLKSIDKTLKLLLERMPEQN